MRGLLWSIAKRLLFLFDAESAHHVTTALVRLGIGLGGVPLRIASGAPSPRRPSPSATSVWGLEFGSRLGLAAGFDKDASLLRGMPDLGFGFAEIGTVTPRPQPGNERPRLFRDVTRQALFNRMGFNSLGAALAAENVARARDRLPPGFRVGVNVGKNKDTPLDAAARDYAEATRPFDGLADYLVINVSSPNTPGLRSLQTRETLAPIVAAVGEVITGWSKRPPLLLKLAPELSEDELASLIRGVEPLGIDGWVLTNTLGGDREGLPGGWSGKVLTELSERGLRAARSATKLPIVSVGGIMTPEDAARRIRGGAQLVQIYSGWVFGGPSLPARIVRELARR